MRSTWARTRASSGSGCCRSAAASRSMGMVGTSTWSLQARGRPVTSVRITGNERSWMVFRNWFWVVGSGDCPTVRVVKAMRRAVRALMAAACVSTRRARL
jgi:hypothetical protein